MLIRCVLKAFSVVSHLTSKQAKWRLIILFYLIGSGLFSDWYLNHSNKSCINLVCASFWWYHLIRICAEPGIPVAQLVEHANHVQRLCLCSSSPEFESDLCPFVACHPPLSQSCLLSHSRLPYPIKPLKRQEKKSKQNKKICAEPVWWQLVFMSTTFSVATLTAEKKLWDKLMC